MLPADAADAVLLGHARRRGEGSGAQVSQQPVRIEIGSVLKPAENVELRTFEVDADKKQELLEHLLARRRAASWSLCAPSTARIAWRGGWFAPATRRRRFTATARSRSATGAAQLLRGPSPGAGGHRRGRSRHRRGQRGARDQLRSAQGGRGLCASRRPHRPRFGARRGFHLCRTGERGDLRKIERTLSIQMKRFRVRSVEMSAA
jgi:ATP-dependent RNA helicase RhlE